MIEWIEKKLLDEQVVVAALDEIRRQLKHRAEEPSDVPELEKRAATLKADVRRLGEALLSTDQPLATVTPMLAERESQLRDVQARIAAREAAPMALDLETRRLEKEARARMADLRGMLQRNRQEGRKVLEKLLTGPLLFTPIHTPLGPRFQINGEADVVNVLGISIEGVPNEIRRRPNTGQLPPNAATSEVGAWVSSDLDGSRTSQGRDGGTTAVADHVRGVPR